MYYFFLIWPNGMDKKQQILNLIPNKIFVKDFEIDNLEKFIFKLYVNENHKHLKCKIDYLKNYKKCKICVCIVEHKSFDVIKIGKTKKSKYIEELKIKIRNLYNPKFDDNNKRIAPLEKGVSHNHIIHSSDTSKCTVHLLNILEINIKLNTNFIPYEIRRNPIKIFYMTDIYYSKKTFYKKYYPDELSNIFSNNINKKLDYKIIDTPVIIFFQSWLQNYGHFILDNLIPIFKIICTYQQDLYPKNNLILYLYRDTSEPINDKWKELLECFVSNVKYFNKDLLFKKAIISHQLFKGPWESTLNDSNNCKIFLNNFIDIIYKKFKVNRINDPKEIIYLSRKNAKWRRVLNEDKIKYKKISFEKLSFVEELEILNKTKIFITPYGAGIVSGFFLSKNSIIIIIYPKGFSYTRDCSTMELDILNKLGIKTICCNHNCEIFATTIYENNITNIDNLKKRDKDIEINIENLEKIVNNLNQNI